MIKKALMDAITTSVTRVIKFYLTHRNIDSICKKECKKEIYFFRIA
jgi:hypothetical protein